MKYYIEEVDPAEWRNVATSKARVDIFNILDSLGYEKITVGCKELSGDYSGVHIIQRPKIYPGQLDDFGYDCCTVFYGI